MLQNVHAIVLAETTARTKRLSDHLSEIGVKWTPFEGVNGELWGLTTVNKYDMGSPDGIIMPQKHVGLHLSHYFLWRRFEDSGEQVMTVLEDDAAFHNRWKEEYKIAMDSVPSDWNVILLGSGFTSNKHKIKVKGNVWIVDSPQCTHAYMINRAALQILLLTQKKSWAPIDSSLMCLSYPWMKVYTVLPRIAYQHGQEYIIP